MPKSAKKMADSLTSLAATLAVRAEEIMTIPICSRWVVSSDDENSKEDINMICVL